MSFLLKFISLAKSDSILLRHVNNNLKINFQINTFKTFKWSKIAVARIWLFKFLLKLPENKQIDWI